MRVNLISHCLASFFGQNLTVSLVSNSSVLGSKCGSWYELRDLVLGSRSDSRHKSNQSGRCVSGLDEVTTFENGFLSRLVACRFASKRKSKLDCNLKGLHSKVG